MSNTATKSATCEECASFFRCLESDRIYPCKDFQKKEHKAKTDKKKAR